MQQLVAISNATPGVDVDKAGVLLAQSSGRLVAVALVGLVAIRLLRLAVRRIDDPRFREQLLFFLPKMIGVIATIAGIAALGIDVSGMAAVMATIGFTGAVVFTPVGQNFVAGAMIRCDDLYQVGEVVTVADLHGKVAYRSLLRTELELPDGSKAWIPNSLFQENQVLNHSRMGGWRICVQIPLDRASDRQRAHEIMNEVMDSLTWNSPGKRAFVAFDHVGGEAMFFNAYAWIDDRTREPWFRGLLLSEMVDALENEGVSVGQTTNLSIGPGRLEPATTTI